MEARGRGRWIGPLTVALVLGAGVWLGGDALLGGDGSLGGGEAIAQFGPDNTDTKAGSSCKLTCKGCYRDPPTEPERCCKDCPPKPKPSEPTPEEVAAMCACLDKHESASACNLRGSQFPPFSSARDGQVYPCPSTKRQRQRLAFCGCAFRAELAGDGPDACRHHLGKGKKTKKRRKRATFRAMCHYSNARF